MPPFTVVTVVEPGYGRRSAWPPKSRIAASSVRRSARTCTTSVYPTSLRVTSRIARRDVVVGDGVLVALDRGQHEAGDRTDRRERGGELLGLGEVERARVDVALDRAGRLGAAIVAPARDHDLPAAAGIGLGEPQPDAGRTSDDDDGSICHGGQR